MYEGGSAALPGQSLLTLILPERAAARGATATLPRSGPCPREPQPRAPQPARRSLPSGTGRGGGGAVLQLGPSGMRAPAAAAQRRPSHRPAPARPPPHLSRPLLARGAPAREGQPLPQPRRWAPPSGAQSPAPGPRPGPSTPGADPRRLLTTRGGSGGAGSAARGGQPGRQPFLPPPSSSGRRPRRQHRPARPLPPFRAALRVSASAAALLVPRRCGAVPPSRAAPVGGEEMAAAELDRPPLSGLPERPRRVG